MKRIVCLLLMLAMLFPAAVPAWGEDKPHPTESQTAELESMLEKVRKEKYKVRDGEMELSSKLFVALYTGDYKVTGTSMAAAAQGQDYCGIPARYLVRDLDEAETVVLIYRTLKTVGHYGGPNGTAAKSTTTWLGVVDRKANVMYKSVSVAKEAPPMVYSSGGKTAGDFKPNEAGKIIAEKLAHMEVREQFSADYASIRKLLNSRLNNKIKVKSAKLSYAGKLVVAVFNMDQSQVETSLEYVAENRDFYSFPASRLAASLKEARTLVLIYPVTKRTGIYTMGGGAYSTKTMITVIDMKKQKQCAETTFSTGAPPSSVSTVNKDHFGAYAAEYALESIVKALE